MSSKFLKKKRNQKKKRYFVVCLVVWFNDFQLSGVDLTMGLIKIDTYGNSFEKLFQAKKWNNF